MELKDQNILLLTRTMGMGGTEEMVLFICEFLNPLANKIIVCSSGGEKVPKLERLGVKHHIIPDMGKKDFGTITSILRILKKIVKDNNITIIHSHHRMAAFYVRLLFGKSILKIVNGHSIFNDKKIFTKYAYHDAKIIAVGNAVKENLIEFYEINKSEVTIIYNTIKPFNSEVSVVPEIAKCHNNGVIVVGNVGRMSEEKGVDYFIKSIPISKNRLEIPVKYFIIGDGEKREELEELAKELNVFDDIVWLGYRTDIQNVIAQIDFLVLSSLWEGYPLTLIEALSVGKAIVATDVGGNKEIVNDNVTGLLVKPKDSEGLSNAIVQLCNDKEKRKQMSINAYSSYEKSFSFVKMKENYIDFYKRL